MRIALLLLVIWLAPVAVAQRSEGAPQPQIAAGLAEETVEVKVNYSGARIVLFATAPAGDSEGTGLAVALIGPPESQEVIRRTPAGEKRFEFVNAPSVFAIGAEPQVAGSVAPEVMIESGLNVAASAMPRADQLNSPNLEAWRAAFVELKMNQGLYSFDDTTIERLDGGLRRARILLPPNAPPGEYRVRAVAFRNGQRVGDTEQKLTLVRSGMDATLFNLSRQHGFIYGFIAVLLGAVAGAIGAWIGRR
ncbi:MAG TPA: TIGR02186 family protein [Hyphomonadaceae bacterium]|nr:TIGR02186 family protein [Hyphomonadaceae bacterium]